MTDKAPANLKDLIEYVSATTGLSLNKTKVLVASVLQGVIQLTEHQGALTIRDFGKFETRYQKSRFHSNPLGGGAKQLPAKKTIHFKLSRKLIKDAN